MKNNRLNQNDSFNDYINSGLPTQFETSYDSLFPESNDPAIQFYVDMMRIYLGIYEGKINFEQALRAVEELKKNPEYVKFPTNPAILPINEEFKNRIVDNLRSIQKYNLVTVDSIRSAYTFAFLMQTMKMNEVDVNVLKYLIDHPLAPNIKIAQELGLSARTVARTLKNLRERNRLRFTCLVDVSTFGIDWVIVFFSMRDESEWPIIDNVLSSFPLSKYVLKTALSPIGYASFLIPGGKQNLNLFVKELSKLASSYFDYHSIHVQKGQGTNVNMSLYTAGAWKFPTILHDFANYMEIDNNDRVPMYIENRGILRGLNLNDFYIASHLKVNFRASSNEIQTTLSIHDIVTTRVQISRSIRKMARNGVIHPYTVFTNIGLTANFAFEITCNEETTGIILRALTHTPKSTYFVSDRGIVAWIQAPSEHQVEYYKLFRSLEKNLQVDSLQSIMTVTRSGSRSMIDLIRGWIYTRQGWTIPKEMLKITDYL